MSSSIQVRWAFATCLIASGHLTHAQATEVTAASGQVTHQVFLEGGSQTLAFSPNMLAFMDVGKTQVTPYAGSEVGILKDEDGFYTQISVQNPLTSIQVNENGTLIENIRSTGGMTLTSPTLKGVSTSGSLTLGDWNISTADRTVSALVIGANGVNTSPSQAIWQATGMQASLTQTGVWDGQGDNALYFYDYTVTLTGLTLTDIGRSTFAQALGLQTLGQAALGTVTDSGTLTTKMTFLAPSHFALAVPEPSTWALMGLGLLGLAVSARRQPRH